MITKIKIIINGIADITMPIHPNVLAAVVLLWFGLLLNTTASNEKINPNINIKTKTIPKIPKTSADDEVAAGFAAWYCWIGLLTSYPQFGQNLAPLSILCPQLVQYCII